MDFCKTDYKKTDYKKPVYYKRKDGIVTLTVKNCDIPLKEIDKFWVSKWKNVSYTSSS